jgi:DNA (cytosine-5)-methyltransferase 1
MWLGTAVIKVLNLYAGIGGNRKLWPNDKIEVTAVEIEPKIAKIYQDFFPNDKVIVADAHQFLLDHFKEFDFIWSSPPCPSHSSFRKDFSCNVGAKPVYPDMKLYEEILLLQGYFKGLFCIENVIGWYKPLIEPQEIQRHYIWSNFKLVNGNFKKDGINLTGGKHIDQDIQIAKLQESHGFNLDKFEGDKRTMLRNCVSPKLGLHIFNMAFNDRQSDLITHTSNTHSLPESGL